MKLLTIGDSFTYGEELGDRNSAWPYLLANKLGYEVTNLARPGSGNTSMVRYAVEQVNTYDLIIIAWSHFARTEIADENGSYDLWPGCNSLPHKECSPWRSEMIGYYNKHHNDDYLYNQYILNIILIQNYLKTNNKKYLMLDTFGNNKHRKNNKFNNQIDLTYYLGWPTETMMEWTYQFPQAPNGHFTEQGHRAVADKIYEYIRHLGWVS